MEEKDFEVWLQEDEYEDFLNRLCDWQHTASFFFEREKGEDGGYYHVFRSREARKIVKTKRFIKENVGS